MTTKRLAEQELANPCIACGGAAHRASGMELPSGKLICGPCVRDFHDWITKHSKKSYRVGPKGSKTAKYIPFPTGIVKENEPIHNPGWHTPDVQLAWKIEEAIRRAYTKQGMRKFYPEQFRKFFPSGSSVGDLLVPFRRLEQEGRLELHTSEPGGRFLDADGKLTIWYELTPDYSEGLEIEQVPDSDVGPYRESKHYMKLNTLLEYLINEQSEVVDSASEPKPDQVVIEDSSLSEKAPPGMEDTVMKLKKQYPDDPEKPYAVAWSIYNRKQGK